MSCKKICPIAQLHWAGSVSKSEWVSWVQLLSRNSMSVISCCYCALPTRYEESVHFSLPLSHVVAPRVKKVVWSLIFLKLSNQPRNLFRHSVGLSYVMVLCFIWASKVPCDMSWWISHFPPPPIPPEQCVPMILALFNWSKVFIYMIWETWIKIGRLYVRRY